MLDMISFIRLRLVRNAVVCALGALLPLDGHAGASAARSTYLAAGAQTLAPVNPPGPVPKLEIGIDRSNMSTEWTLSPPAEPNIYPFIGSYNGTGVFEERRVAVFDG